MLNILIVDAGQFTITWMFAQEKNIDMLTDAKHTHTHMWKDL